MIAVNENIKELYKSDSVPKQYQISIYRSNLGALFPADDLYPSDTLFPLAGDEADIIIENDRIVGENITLRQSICDSGDIIFGKCNAAEFTFECADVTNIYVGDELLVKQYINGEPVSIGAFYVASIKKSADRRFRTITAYDRMTFFDRNVADWYNGLWVGGTTSITLGALRNSLCNYCGVPVRSTSLVNDSMTVKKTMVPTEISGRDIIESICEINGVFGIIDNEGFFTFISLNTDEAVEEIPIGIRKSLEHEDYTVSPINALVIRQESNDIGASVGEGDNPYIIQGNFLVYGKSSAELTTIATNVFNAISNITYVPVRLQCRGLPYIEPGDCIEIEMRDGSHIKTLVLSRSLSGVQSLTDDITASGSEKRVETYGLSKSIIQIQGKANILERTVEANKLRVEDLEQGYSELIQTSESITTRVETVEGDISELEQTASSLSARITDAEGNISNLQLTASNLISRISSAEGNISTLQQTASSLSSKITSAEGNISNLQQTASSLSASVISINGRVNSLELDFDGLTLSASNYGTSSTIFLSSRGIYLSSTNVAFTGVVTFSDLTGYGTTQINGANIMTGTISSSKLARNPANSYIEFNSNLYLAPPAYSIAGLDALYFDASMYIYESGGKLTLYSYNGVNITGGGLYVNGVRVY